MVVQFSCISLFLILLFAKSNKCREVGILEEDNSLNKNLIYYFKNVKITLNNKINLEINSPKRNGKPKLSGELGVNVPSDLKPDIRIFKNTFSIQWGQNISLKIEEDEKSACHKVTWESDLDLPLEDCFRYGDSNWYGGPEIIVQKWPIEQLYFNEVPYITQMFDNIAIVEPYWLNSNGAYIYVSPKTPLFIDSNNHKIDNLCFIAIDKAPYLKREKNILEYNVCGFDNPRKAQEHAVFNFLGKPTGLPDKKMIEHPIWSTWVRYKLDVNETIVLKFAKEIVNYGFNNSQIEIDDNWETCYGSTKFNSSRFHNMKELSSKLKNLGFRITIWVHPFVNTDCPNYNELAAKGYFVKNTNGEIDTAWWDGEAAGVDFTNPKAVSWFRDLHDKIMTENDIDGLKFDAGESSWLPQIPVLNCTEENHPNAYTSAYIDTISAFSSTPLEIRSTYRGQHHPIFLRMLDKDTRWSFNNGLPTIITTLLVMNIQGYPWVLPDMIGGNAYNDDKLDKELFIRWLQANTFMPSIQFSVPPWDFDFETIEITKKFLDLHYQYSSLIIELMEKTVQTGAPLNPPIWWVDPNNPEAHKIYSEYLLGEDILVAPVIEKGSNRRDIYLPKGCWADGNNPDRIYKGRRWLKNYYADLYILPYFIRSNTPCTHMSFKNESGEVRVKEL